VMARQGVGGTLELAVVPTFGTRWLLPRLPDFAHRHPGITINLASRTRPFLFDDSGLDAAIYAGDGNWPGTVATRLLSERLVPVCSPALIAPRKRLTPKQLAALPLLQQATRPYAWRQWFESAGHVPGHELVGPRYELFSMSLQAALVGMGVALVPDHAAADEIAAGRLVVPVPHVGPSDSAYFFVSPERSSEQPVIAALRGWLVEQATMESA
jgi:DNA-binding transcriptional LysR family regulator